MTNILNTQNVSISIGPSSVSNIKTISNVSTNW